MPETIRTRDCGRTTGRTPTRPALACGQAPPVSSRALLLAPPASPRALLLAVPVSPRTLLLRALLVLMLCAAALSLPHTAHADEPDDNMPGVAIPTSPHTGAINKWSDPDDVFAVYLARGQTLEVSVRAESEGLDLDLYLFNPHATYKGQSDAIVASSNGKKDPETITWTAVEWGTHFLDIRAWDKKGVYRLEYEVSGPWVPEPSGNPETEPNNSFDEAKPLTFSPQAGTLASVWADSSDYFSFSLSKGQTFSASLFWDNPGVDMNLNIYGPAREDVTKAWGEEMPAELSFAAAVSGTYYIRPWLMTNYGDDYVLTYTITGAPAKTTPTVGTPQAPARMKRNKSYTVSGTLSPRHMKGAVVRVYKYLKSGRNYVSKKYVNAMVGSDGRWSVKMSLPTKGTWRLRAYAPADDLHKSAWSKKYDTVTVY